MTFRSKLWRALHESKNHIEEWEAVKFINIDVNDITNKSEYYTKIAMQCERNLPKGSSAVR